MKKILTALIFAAIAGSAFAQGSLKPVAGVSIDKNTSLPVFWLIQAQPVDKKTAKTTLDKNGKSVSVTVSPKVSHLDFFGNALAFEKGDEFTLTAKVKGTGTVRLGFMGYNAGNKFLYSSRGKAYVLTGKEQVITEKFVVNDGKDYPVAKIRPSLRVDKGAVCEISSVVLTEE